MQIDPNNYYANSVNAKWTSEEELSLIIQSGDVARMFSFSPKHTKRILLLLQGLVNVYEATHGELKTKLPLPETGKPQKTTEEVVKGFAVQEEEAENDGTEIEINQMVQKLIKKK